MTWDDLDDLGTHAFSQAGGRWAGWRMGAWQAGVGLRPGHHVPNGGPCAKTNVGRHPAF